MRMSWSDTLITEKLVENCLGWFGPKKVNRCAGEEGGPNN